MEQPQEIQITDGNVKIEDNAENIPPSIIAAIKYTEKAFADQGDDIDHIDSFIAGVEWEKQQLIKYYKKRI